MKTLKLLSIASIFLLNHCNKAAPPLPTYTVKGAIINGTTGQPLDIGQQVQLEVTQLPQYSPNGIIQTAILGTCTIDDSGKFNFTYTQTNITDRGAYLRIDIQVGHFGNVPVNQNVNQNIYISSMGTLKIKVQTKNPLEINKDTLYIVYFQNGTPVYDTITKTLNGVLATFRTPPPSANIVWGRGYKVFEENLNGPYSFNDISVHITGDPVIDSVTINY